MISFRSLPARVLVMLEQFAGVAYRRVVLSVNWDDDRSSQRQENILFPRPVSGSIKAFVRGGWRGDSFIAL
jgi:hypothetical protein